MNNASILLVETDQNLRHSIALILKRTGYSVTGTDSFDKSQELLSSTAFHLLILDIDGQKYGQMMPPLNGNHYNGVPLLILTEHSILNKAQEGGSSKVQYLVKPIAPETLLDRVGKILKQNHQQHGSSSNFLKNLAV